MNKHKIKKSTLIISILISILVLNVFFGAFSVKAYDFFGMYGRIMPWKDDPSWGLGSGSMLNLCSNYGCYGIPNFSSHFQRNGNSLPNVGILAISDGIIESVSFDSYYGCGNFVSINHTNGYVSKTCHFTDFGNNPRTGARWKSGDQVKRGEYLGYIYSSMSSTRDIYFLMWSTSKNTMVNPSEAGNFDACHAYSQYSTNWDYCPVTNFASIRSYAPVRSWHTGVRGFAAWEPPMSYPPLSDVKNFGYFLPQGYNANIISEANQNISVTPFEIAEDPVNTLTGNMNHISVDLEYPEIAGVPFEFRRSYNSSETNNGILGKGWRASYDMQIIPNNLLNSAYWTVLFPEGHGETFQDVDNNYASLESNYNSVNPESKGVLSRSTSDYSFTYTDNQTKQQFIFDGNRNSASFGKLGKIVYPNGVIVTLSYTGNLLTTVTDSVNNRSFNFQYSGVNLSKITDNTGRSVTYTYNMDSLIASVTNPIGGITKYDYNVNQKINKITNPNNIVEKTITYSSDGKVSSITDGNGNTKSYGYTTDALGKLGIITDAQGNTTKHWHNSNNYLIQVQYPNNEIIKYEYDSKGNRTKEITPDGKIYQFTYDSLGNRTSSIFPDGSKIESVYNDAGKPTQIKETPAVGYGDQRIKYFDYDSYKNISLYTDAQGARKYYSYNENKQLATESDENSSAYNVLNEFGSASGWNSRDHVRLIGDVNGDGMDDIVGCGASGTGVSLANGNKTGYAFNAPTQWSNTFGYANTWRVESHPRILADVNGDGKKDLVGFGHDGIYVALSNGTSFNDPSIWLFDLGAGQGWLVSKHVRGAGDVNGDGKEDIIAIGDSQTFVALSTGNSFQSKQVWLNSLAFTANGTWSVNYHPRMFADVNGDGKADIIGIGTWSIEVALSNGASFNNPGTWRKGFGDIVGWQISRHPRVMFDMNNDGKADLVGFGENEVLVAYSEGNKFSDIAQTIDIGFTAARGFDSADALRLVGDYNGDNKGDILGFVGATWGTTLEGETKSKLYDTYGYLAYEKVYSVGNNSQTVPQPNQSPTKDSETVNSYHFDYINDSSSNGNNLTQSGTVKNVDGKFSGAMRFEENGYLSGNLNGLNASSNTITVSFWANPVYTGNPISVMAATPDEATNRLNIHFPWSDGNVYWDYGNLTTTGRLVTKFNSSWYNQWAYYTFTSDTSGMKMYRNGLLVNSSSSYSTFTKGTKKLVVGSFNGSYNWRGTLDEFKILNKSLTPAEVENEYNKYQNYALQGATTEYKNDKLGNVLSTKDANGNISTATYNALNQVLTSTDAKGNTTIYEYNNLGKLIKETDASGLVKTYTYDNNGNTTKIQVGDSKITQFVYDKNNNKIKEIDAIGNYTVITYDSINRPTKQEYFDKDNNLLSTTSQTYNSAGLKATETDGNGVVTTYTYDNLNHVKTIAKGTTSKSVKYDFWGNLLTETDWEGRTYEYTYDKLNRLLTTKNPLEKVGQGLGTTNKYDKAGNLFEIKDTNGNITKQFFDINKNLIKVINPAGKVATYEYDKLGNLVKQTNFANEITTFAYDPNNNVTSKTDALSNVTLFEYDNRNLNTKVTDANGFATTMGYNQLAQNTSITNHLQKSKGISYDLNGNVISITDEENNTTTYSYDGLGRKKTETKKQNVNGSLADVTIEFSYDANGNLLSQKDGKGNVSTFEYDNFNRITKSTNADQKTKELTYSANGNLKSLKDENGNVTTFTYDELNRKTQEKDALNNIKSFTYDFANRVKSESDFKTKTNVYEYDVLGNVTKLTDRDGKVTNYTYNSANKVATIAYPSGLNLTNTYDGLGRLTKTSKTGGALIPVEESYTYDKAGNVITSTDSKGNVTSYTYNEIYKLVKVIDPSGNQSLFNYNAKGEITSKTDQKGNTTTIAYDPQGNITAVTDALNQTQTFKYDANKNLIEQIDKKGNSQKFDYDTLNRTVKITATGDITISQMQYDAKGNLTTKLDANNQSTTYTYDANNRVKTIKDALNGLLTYEYDENGNLTKEIDPLNGSANYTYDSLDRVVQATDKNGFAWTYQYDAMGNLVSQKDPKNNIVTNTYDLLGRKIKTSQDAGSIGIVETFFDYDNNNNLTKVTDPIGNAITNEYDNLNRLVKSYNQNLEAKEYAYDAIGNVTQVKDENGKITKYSYDKLNRKYEEIDALNNKITYGFDANNNVISATDPTGNTQTSVYDSLNRLITAIDALNNSTSYTYDNNNNLLKETKAEGNSFDYTYDALNRLVKVAQGENVIEQSEYDALGRLTKSINGELQATTYQYDKLNRLTQVSDALNNRTTYQYDELGNMTKEINPNLAETTYTYNKLNKVATETDALGKVWTFEYDKLGNIVKETDAKGQINVRTYDINNRLTAKKYLDNQGNATGESTYFEYDKVGNVTKAYNANLTNTFAYDDVYNLTSANNSANKNIGYQYDANRNNTSISYPNGKSVDYTYNALGKVSSLTVKYTGDTLANTAAMNLTTNFTYNKNGNLVTQSNPDQSAIKYVYDSLDRITEISNFKQSSNGTDIDYVIAKYVYSYNKNNDKTEVNYFSNCSKTNECNSTTEFTSTDVYSYDVARRLTGVTHTVSDAVNMAEPNYTDSYAYDAAGNRTQMLTNRSGNNKTISYTYNAGNQLIDDSDWTYTYDNNGNRTSKIAKSSGGSVSLTYDRANDLVGVNSTLLSDAGTLESYNLTYKYDAFGRRYLKQNNVVVPFEVGNQNNAYKGIESQEYVFDKAGWDVLAEYTNRVSANGVYNVHSNFYQVDLGKGMLTQVLSEDVADRAITSDIANDWDWVSDSESADPESNWILSPDSVQRFSYYQRDALDSVVSKSNLNVKYRASFETGDMVYGNGFVSGSQVVNQVKFDVYGQKLNGVQSNALGGGFNDWSSVQYSGRIFDIEMSGYYYGSRIYDSATGTWNKQDSYRGEANKPITRHRYAFVGNNPVNNVDKYGFSAEDDYKVALQTRDLIQGQYNKLGALVDSAQKSESDAWWQRHYTYWAKQGALAALIKKTGEPGGIFNLGPYINSFEFASSVHDMACVSYNKALANLESLKKSQQTVGRLLEDAKKKADDLNKVYTESVVSDKQKLQNANPADYRVTTVTGSDNRNDVQKWIDQTVAPFRGTMEMQQMETEVGYKATESQYNVIIVNKVYQSNAAAKSALKKKLSVLVSSGSSDVITINRLKEQIDDLEIAMYYNRKEIEELGGKVDQEWKDVEQGMENLQDLPAIGAGVDFYYAAEGRMVDGQILSDGERLGNFGHGILNIVSSSLTIQTAGQLAAGLPQAVSGAKSFVTSVAKSTSGVASTFKQTLVGWGKLTVENSIDDIINSSSIKVSEAAKQHIIDRHTFNSLTRWADKSKFFDTTNFSQLINSSGKMDSYFEYIAKNGLKVKVVEFVDDIGIDTFTKQATKFMTTAVDKFSNLISAYPGKP